MLQPLLVLVLAYLLGSFSGSLVMGRWLGIDIRGHGSGNAGGTNALRIMGWRMALMVVCIDVGKGMLAAGLALVLSPGEGLVAPATLAFAAILFAMAGHTWPLYFGLRGGKGAATLVGGLVVVWPASVPVVLGVWLLCLGLTGYVGLSTILAAAGLLPLAWLLFPDPVKLAFAFAAGGFIIFTHRYNLQRLRQGREPRFERAWVLGRLLRRGRT